MQLKRKDSPMAFEHDDFALEQPAGPRYYQCSHLRAGRQTGSIRGKVASELGLASLSPMMSHAFN